MTYAVAFFRNLNLGHRGSPTRAELLGACREAGAVEAASFRTNGTVLFHAANPTPVARRAGRLLADTCGWRDYVAVRSASWCRRVAAGLARDFPAGVPAALEVSLFEAPRDLPLPSPGLTSDGRIDILRIDHRHAVSVPGPGVGPGAATAALERLLPCSVTSRVGGTMLRLAVLLDQGS